MELDDVKIEFKTLSEKRYKRRIKTSLRDLLKERVSGKDRRSLSEKTDTVKKESSVGDNIVLGNEKPSSGGEDHAATVEDVLKKFKTIDGFQAVGVFSPNGEMVADYNTAGINMAELGALANDVMLKSQKTTELMDVGRGQLVHVEAPKAHVICRCLNEATDFATTSSGMAHVHLVLILDREGNVAMGKMKMESLMQEVAQFFR